MYTAPTTSGSTATSPSRRPRTRSRNASVRFDEQELVIRVGDDERRFKREHGHDIVLWPGRAAPKLGLGLYAAAPMLAFLVELIYDMFCW